VQDIEAWRFPLKHCAGLERELVIFGRCSTSFALPAWLDGNSYPEACTRSDCTDYFLSTPHVCRVNIIRLRRPHRLGALNQRLPFVGPEATLRSTERLSGKEFYAVAVTIETVSPTSVEYPPCYARPSPQYS
jgi:hypothetical protein